MIKLIVVLVSGFSLISTPIIIITHSTIIKMFIDWLMVLKQRKYSECQKNSKNLHTW